MEMNLEANDRYLEGVRERFLILGFFIMIALISKNRL
jgi:hypothetical protein